MSKLREYVIRGLAEGAGRDEEWAKLKLVELECRNGHDVEEDLAPLLGCEGCEDDDCQMMSARIFGEAIAAELVDSEIDSL